MNRTDRYRILISVFDDNLGEILDHYKSEDFKYLDAFELKELLKNICESIILEYKRDLQLAETDIMNSHQIIKLKSM